MESLRNTVESLLHLKNLNLNVLSKSIGMTRTGLLKSLDNGTLSVAMLLKMATTLSISPAEILTGYDPQSEADRLMKEIKDRDQECAEMRKKVAEMEKILKENDLLLKQMEDRLNDKEEIIKLLKSKTTA